KEQTARNRIAERGLTVRNVSQRASCDLVGKVLEQEPQPFRVTRVKVKVGTSVDLVVGSVGENPQKVPDLSGQGQREAQSTIQELGFTLKEVKTDESDRPEGTVIDQSPERDRQFARGCPVNV